MWERLFRAPQGLARVCPALDVVREGAAVIDEGTFPRGQEEREGLVAESKDCVGESKGVLG